MINEYIWRIWMNIYMNVCINEGINVCSDVWINGMYVWKHESMSVYMHE
jgi:hypothetical protein